MRRSPLFSAPVLVFGAGSALAAGGTSQHGDVILGTKYGSKLLPVAGTAPALRAAAPGASAAAAEVGDVKYLARPERRDGRPVR